MDLRDTFRMLAQAAEQRRIEIDAKRAALTYSQMVDGFWIGWVMDRKAYTMKEATEIVCDWVLDLLGEKRLTRRKSPTSGKAITNKGKSRRKPARA